jgi:hypothetical protein
VIDCREEFPLGCLFFEVYILDLDPLHFKREDPHSRLYFARNTHLSRLL